MYILIKSHKMNWILFKFPSYVLKSFEDIDWNIFYIPMAGMTQEMPLIFYTFLNYSPYTLKAIFKKFTFCSSWSCFWDADILPTGVTVITRLVSKSFSRCLEMKQYNYRVCFLIPLDVDMPWSYTLHHFMERWQHHICLPTEEPQIDLNVWVSQHHLVSPTILWQS